MSSVTHTFRAKIRQYFEGLQHSFSVVIFVVILAFSISVLSTSEANAATLTCVEKSYAYGSSSTCVKYAKQLANGITTKFAGTRYDFSTESLSNTSLYISNSFSSSLKNRLINLQRWGYQLTPTGTLDSGTWKELCGFAKTTMLIAPKPWSSTVRTMHSAYEIASCYKAGASSNPHVQYIAETDATYNVGTWNSLYSNSSSVATGIKGLLNTNGLDVVGVQEVHREAQRDRVKAMICSSCAQSGYLASYSSGSAGPASYPIVWDREVFNKIGVGSYKKVTDYLYYSDKRLLPRYLTWVKLEHNATGKQFYIINTHTVSAVDVNGTFGQYTNLNDAYKRHMTELGSLVTALKTENLPIFAVGDFNVDYRKDVVVQTPGFAYASLSQVDMKSNWEIMNLAEVDPLKGTIGSSNKLIDYVFVWTYPGIDMVSTKIVTSRYGSDHSPVASSMTHVHSNTTSQTQVTLNEL